MKAILSFVLFVGAATPVLGQAVPPQEAPKDLKPVKVSGTEYKMGTLSFDSKTREIWFPATVHQNEVLLEFAVAEETRGKLHESLLATKTTPFEIQIAMKLNRWEPSKRDIYREYNDEGQPIGELKDDGKGRMEILVRYKDKGGKEVTEPLGNWVHNTQTKKPVGAGVWTYTGSLVKEGYFLAAEDGAIAAVYRYEGSLCNAFNPGSDDDELWFPIPEKVPPLETEVTVILKPLPAVEVPKDRRLPKAGAAAKPEAKTDSKADSE